MLKFEDKILLTKLNIDESSASYKIVLEYPQVIKFIEKSTQVGEEKITFSPGEVFFQVMFGEENLKYTLKEITEKDDNGEDVKVKKESYSLNIQYYDQNSKESKFWRSWPKENDEFIYFGRKNKGELEICELRIQDFLETKLNEETEENIKQLQSILKNQETFLKLSISVNNELVTEIPLEISWGIPEQLAKFEVNATSINAMVGKGSLQFSDSGMTITNGNFSIIQKSDNDSTTLLGTDKEGNFFLKGNIYADNGYFKGEVEATSGSFTGKIYASTGELGDLRLKGKLYLDEDSFIISGRPEFLEGEEEVYSVISHEKFSIDSLGRVRADLLDLGTGARITDYLYFGNNDTLDDERAYLYNPNLHNGAILSAGKYNSKKPALEIINKGQIKFGNGMLIDGTMDSISSGRYITSAGASGWCLNNDEARFNNAVISGSLKATTFEYGKVQSVGGIIIIRPSSIIKQASYSSTGENAKLVVVLEEIEGFNIGDFCEIALSLDGEEKYLFQIEQINKNEKKLEMKSFSSNKISEALWIGSSIINYGHKNDSTAIAINSSTNASFCAPRSISVFEINTDSEENFFSKTNKVILGYLPYDLGNGFSNFYNPGSYGLFAENALLKGSLISTNSDGTRTAGISSNSGIKMPQIDPTIMPNWKSGELFIWAGENASQTEKETYYPFMVDSNGNFYASNGYFVGSVFSRATIEAATIKTAEIIGTGRDPNRGYNKDCALTIKNVYEAIRFNAINGEKEETIMSLSEEGMKLSKNITLMNRADISEVNSIYSKLLNTNRIELTKEAIISFPTEKIYIQEKENSLIFTNQKEKIILSNNSTQIFDEDIWLSDNIIFGRSERKFEFKPYYKEGTMLGYDLYVRE